jgi:hypothetical protein
VPNERTPDLSLFLDMLLTLQAIGATVGWSSTTPGRSPSLTCRLWNGGATAGSRRRVGRWRGDRALPVEW